MTYSSGVETLCGQFTVTGEFPAQRQQHTQFGRETHSYGVLDCAFSLSRTVRSKIKCELENRAALSSSKQAGNSRKNTSLHGQLFTTADTHIAHWCHNSQSLKYGYSNAGLPSMPWVYLPVMMTSSNGKISALLVLCEGNSPVTGEFPSQRPVTRSFGVFFDLSLNKRLSKPTRRRWFETQSPSLWHHCNGKCNCAFQFHIKCAFTP